MKDRLLQLFPETPENEVERSISVASLWYEGENDEQRKSGGNKAKAVENYAAWLLSDKEPPYLKIAKQYLPTTDPSKLFKRC